MKPTPANNSKKQSDVIEEYFADKSDAKEFIVSKELFEAKDNIDLKTELNQQERWLFTILSVNDDFLKKKLGKRVFAPLMERYMRFSVSLDRQARKEFVTVNQNQNTTTDALDIMSKVKTLQDDKK